MSARESQRSMSTVDIDEEELQNALTIKGQFSLCLKDFHFMFAMTSTSLQITFFYVFATVIGQLITPFGFDSASF